MTAEEFIGVKHQPEDVELAKQYWSIILLEPPTNYQIVAVAKLIRYTKEAFKK